MNDWIRKTKIEHDASFYDQIFIRCSDWFVLPSHTKHLKAVGVSQYPNDTQTRNGLGSWTIDDLSFFSHFTLDCSQNSSHINLGLFQLIFLKNVLSKAQSRISLTFACRWHEHTLSLTSIRTNQTVTLWRLMSDRVVSASSHTLVKEHRRECSITFSLYSNTAMNVGDNVVIWKKFSVSTSHRAACLWPHRYTRHLADIPGLQGNLSLVYKKYTPPRTPGIYALERVRNRDYTRKRLHCRH